MDYPLRIYKGYGVYLLPHSLRVKQVGDRDFVHSERFYSMDAAIDFIDSLERQ